MKTILSNNKKAYYDYYIEEKLEAGIVLAGTEVKSVKAGKCSIKESYVKIENGECFIIGMNITPYENRDIVFRMDPVRPRKLLLHKTEIRKLESIVATKGYTLVPLNVYEQNGLVKVELGVAKGKHNYDKRNSIKERDMKRQMSKY
jgi:SsrA-binding protein